MIRADSLAKADAILASDGGREMGGLITITHERYASLLADHAALRELRKANG